MDFSNIFDTKAMIASLLSGGFVLFIAWLYKVSQNRKSNKRLRTLVFYEIFLLNDHLNSIKGLLDQSKDEWYRSQIVPGMILTVYENSKVQESLIGLDEKELLAILKFYNFYLSIEKKLHTYCAHLQKKIDTDKNYNSKERIKQYEDLLTESTQGLVADFEELSKIYDNISQSDEYKNVLVKLDLVPEIQSNQTQSK